MKDMEEFLRENRPAPPDEGQFLIETNARLSNVEGIKKVVDEEHRRGRIALLIALAGGLVLGCLVALFVLFCPLPAPDADWSAIAKSVEFLKEWKWILLLPVAACAVSLGLLLVNRKETL